MPTSQPTTKNGNIILRSVSVPNQVDPGDPYKVDVVVSNGAAYINPWDDDKCGLAPPGYKIRVVLKGPNGEEFTKTACHTTTEIGTRDETYTFTVTAPDSGRAVVEAYVEMRGSGKRTDALEASTVVSNEVAEQPDAGANESNTQSPTSNPFDSNIPGGSPFGSVQTWQAILVLLAVAWMLSSGSDIAEGL